MDPEGGIVDSNDITDSVNNWKILESSGVDDNLSPVLFVLRIQGWVNNLDGADESVAIDLVWESGIRDNTIEVHWIG